MRPLPSRRAATDWLRRGSRIGLATGIVLLSTAAGAQHQSLVVEEGAASVGATSRHEPASLRVEYQAGNLSVSAEQMPLAQVLREVARQTGLDIWGVEGLQDQVSVRFSRLPLHEGLPRLLAPVNYLLLGGASPQGEVRPTRVLVFGRRVAPLGQPSETPAGEAGTLVAEGEGQEERLKALDACARQGDEAALRQALLDPDEGVQLRALELLAQRDSQQAVAFVLDLTKSDQPEIRAQALHLLHESGYAEAETVVAVLGTALADTEVRDYAIQALADRGGPDAMEYLRQAFRDPDPSVRRLVIESAAPQGQSLPLLREARADPDETISSFAEFWLKQAAAEGMADSPSASP